MVKNPHHFKEKRVTRKARKKTVTQAEKRVI